MPTFTEHFNIPPNQPVDFVDIPLIPDVLLFIDPFLIANYRNFPINNRLYLQLRDFFTKLNRDFIIPNDKVNGLQFLDFLHEPNEYHLGYSDVNKGKSISKTKADVIFDALRNNRFAQQGISYTNEAHNVLLLVSGIGPDIMSDTIANVCRNEFADFTYQQCQLYHIQTSPHQTHYYDINTHSWVTQTFDLPSYMGRPIILIPKFDAAYPRYYAGYFNWFIARDYIAPDIINGKIVVQNLNDFIKTSKDGDKIAIVKKILDAYKKPKDDLIDFVLQYDTSVDDFLAYAKVHYPAADL